tara:strand:- start:321 stop:560 length:240 start_codon:yes stop_codon:yes gene_type:complete
MMSSCNLSPGDMVHLKIDCPASWWRDKMGIVASVGEPRGTELERENYPIELAVIDGGTVRTLYSCSVYLKDCAVIKRSK